MIILSIKINRNNKTVLFSCRWWPVFQTEGCFPGNWERMPARPSSGWVDNWLLVQLLLLKDEGSKTLDETAFFQQLLKPDLVKTVLLSRLQYLWSTDWRSCLEASHFQNFHLFTAMVAASRDVNKWKRNLTQEMSTEQIKSEPDEPEFETSFKFQQEGDLVAVYNVEDFFIISTGGWPCGSLQCRRFLYQRSHQGH